MSSSLENSEENSEKAPIKEVSEVSSTISFFFSPNKMRSYSPFYDVRGSHARLPTNGISLSILSLHSLSVFSHSLCLSSFRQTLSLLLFVSFAEDFMGLCHSFPSEAEHLSLSKSLEFMYYQEEQVFALFVGPQLRTPPPTVNKDAAFK